MIESAQKKRISDPSSQQLTSTAQSRLDPISGNWTIFAPEREQRPDEFVEQRPSINSAVECPFCGGNESHHSACRLGRTLAENGEPNSTDSAITDSDDLSTDDWSVRVVPNKFPAVGSIDDASCNAATGKTRRESPLFAHRPIHGGHEVVIESRRHVHSLTQLDRAEVDLVFQAYRDRLLHYRSVPGIQYTSVFKNVGQRAGTSLRHAHSQIVATDRLPQPVEASIERMQRHRATTGCCLQCDLIREERRAKERLVAYDDSVIAFCPFASHLPMMVRITTLEHQACFEDVSDRTLASVSRMVFRVISWLEKLRPGTAYNYCLHTRPPGIKDSTDAYHWSIDIFPRMTQIAGFEWGSGCMINPTLPETVAAKFRQCAIAEDPRHVLA